MLTDYVPLTSKGAQNNVDFGSPNMGKMEMLISRNWSSTLVENLKWLMTVQSQRILNESLGCRLLIILTPKDKTPK